MIISTIGVDDWGNYRVVDVKHVPDRPVSRAARQERMRMERWLDGIRFDHTKAQALRMAERVGAAK
jgi:hypothetical protein